MGFVCRWAPASQAVLEHVAAGRLGRIYHAKASLYRRRGIPGLGRWFTTRSRSGGGVLVDLGIHLLDLVLYLTGSPKATRAAAACTSTFGSPIDQYRFEEMWAGPPDPAGTFDVEDAVTALIGFENGMTLQLDVAWAANVPEGIFRNGVLLLGDRGGCFFDLWRNELVLTTEEGGELRDERPALPEGDAWMAAWRKEYELFARSVSQRHSPAATAEDGRTVQRLIDALYRAAAQGREVEIE